MRSITRTAGAAFATAALALSLLATTAAPATAATAHPSKKTPGVPFDYWVNATTTLKKLNQTVTIPRGTFKGSIDLAASTLTGSITLPEATAPVSAAGLPPLATATFKISEVKPVTGTVSFATLKVTATSIFNIQLVSLTPAGLPINLVGDSCTTSKPVSVTMSGSLTSPLEFSGKYTIPPLQNCGALTTVLNQVVPGPGNEFAATATPKKS
jgi:hypothetical protein